MLDDAIKARLDNEIRSEQVVLFMKVHLSFRNVDFPQPLSAFSHILA